MLSSLFTFYNVLAVQGKEIIGDEMLVVPFVALDELLCEQRHAHLAPRATLERDGNLSTHEATARAHFSPH